MGRVNKTIEGVFVDIVGDTETISSYDSFISYNLKNPAPDVKPFISEYKKLIDTKKDDFEKLAHLEEIIMQMNSMHNLNDIKITIVRDYIYARCPFYRKDKSSKDIRIIVDHLDLWKERLDEIETSPILLERAKVKLTKVMEQEIEDNIINFKEKYKKVKSPGK